MTRVNSSLPASLFKFYTEETIIKQHDDYGGGFIFDEDDQVNEDGMLHFISDNKKVFLRVIPAHYHYTIDFYGNIINFLNIDPKIIFIFSSRDLSYLPGDRQKFFYDFMEKNNAIFYFVDEKFDGKIKANNFYLPYATHGLPEPVPFDAPLYHEKFFEYVEDKDTLPYKKIYVSRKKSEQQKEILSRGKLLSGENDKMQDDSKIRHIGLVYKRIDDEEKMEQFFVSHGFEIVYAEDFNNNFINQINYFSKAKLLVGISGAGLTNAIFMKNGGHVVELSTSHFFKEPNAIYNEISETEHDFYKILSRMKNLFYHAIPNNNMSSDDVLEQISNDKFLMSLISG